MAVAFGALGISSLATAIGLFTGLKNNRDGESPTRRESRERLRT